MRHNALDALAAGLRLSLPGPVKPGSYHATPGGFLGVVLVCQLASFGLSWLAVEPPRAFAEYALQSEAFYLLLLLGLCFGLCVVNACGERTLTFATLLLAASLVAGTVTTLYSDHVLPRAMPGNPALYYAFIAWCALWWWAIWARTMTLLDIGRPNLRLATALAVVAVLVVLPHYVTPWRYWDRDYAALYESEQAGEPKPLVAEEVFARQPELLDRALADLAPGVAGTPELYFVAFGPYGDQDVFLKESLYSTELFETRFGAKGRTVTLVNNPQKVEELPLASVSNLGSVLRRIGEAMNVDEDILFLFLTSHGSPDAVLSVWLSGLSFKPLTAEALATVVKDSGIRWKVLVVSGCYSGTFLDALKDDHALVISASRPDRNSFGCSDGAEFTYFGRAFFKEALNQTRSFTEAFAIATRLLDEWETAENRTKSEPQMVVGERIEAHLARWRETLPWRP